MVLTPLDCSSAVRPHASKARSRVRLLLIVGPTAYWRHKQENHEYVELFTQNCRQLLKSSICSKINSLTNFAFLDASMFAIFVSKDRSLP